VLRKLPIVAILGQGARIAADRAALARAAGAMVARLGAHLLTGGGYGVMEAAAQGFVGVSERAGLSIGIIPREPDGPLDQPNHDPDGRRYPNPFIELAIYTPLPPRAEHWQSTPSRNHINIFTADAFVALPGNAGTKNELDMAAFYRDEAAKPREQRRTVLLGPAQEFTPAHRDRFVQVENLADAEQHLRRVLTERGYALVRGARHERVAG
jgi:predicted Rossmann-fold nucleotide-binding protein